MALYIVPTPIGNLEDMTFRAVRLLKEADLVLCEDTRHSKPLLDHFGISANTMSYHKFNEKERVNQILNRLAKGEEICLISDAGLPGISDPGSILIREVQKANLPYTVLPGASASVTAAVAASFGEGPFLFYGFLPQKKTEREKLYQDLIHLGFPVVFYEAPHRIRKTAQELREKLPGTHFYARELTKHFEEYLMFSSEEDYVEKLEERGEYVIVILPKGEEVGFEEDLKKLLDGGMSLKAASEYLAGVGKGKKNEIYRKGLSIGEKDGHL